MNESIINFADVEDDILNYEATDEAVEAAVEYSKAEQETRQLPSVRVWIPAPPEHLLNSSHSNDEADRNASNRQRQIRKTVSEL
jgi:hypothetical protein